jgi:hypothetical protein
MSTVWANVRLVVPHAIYYPMRSNEFSGLAGVCGGRGSTSHQALRISSTVAPRYPAPVVVPPASKSRPSLRATVVVDLFTVSLSPRISRRFCTTCDASLLRPRSEPKRCSRSERNYGMPQRLAEGNICRGFAMVGLGQVAEGIEHLRSGLTGWNATGARVFQTQWFGFLAEGHVQAGQLDDALTAHLPGRGRRSRGRS